jgi:hypothetical protein
MRKRSRTPLTSESGASLVEFAIVAPVLIFFLIGMIEVARYTQIAIVASNAARAGVAYGAQNTTTAADTSGMQSAALANASAFPSMSANPTMFCYSGSGTPSPSPCPSSPPAGSYYYVQVTTTGTFNSWFNYPGIPNNVPISATAVMKVIDQ